MMSLEGVTMKRVVNYGLIPEEGVTLYPDACCTDDCDSPFPLLVAREVHSIQRRCGFSPRQAQVFEWYVVRGLSMRQISAVLDLRLSTVSGYLREALTKAERCPHLGLLTVMLEVFGSWELIREALRDRR